MCNIIQLHRCILVVFVYAGLMLIIFVRFCLLVFMHFTLFVTSVASQYSLAIFTVLFFSFPAVMLVCVCVNLILLFLISLLWSDLFFLFLIVVRCCATFSHWDVWSSLGCLICSVLAACWIFVMPVLGAGACSRVELIHSVYWPDHVIWLWQHFSLVIITCAVLYITVLWFCMRCDYQNVKLAVKAMFSMIKLCILVILHCQSLLLLYSDCCGVWYCVTLITVSLLTIEVWLCFLLLIKYVGTLLKCPVNFPKIAILSGFLT